VATRCKQSGFRFTVLREADDDLATGTFHAACSSVTNHAVVSLELEGGGTVLLAWPRSSDTLVLLIFSTKTI
jgi:hypothetical protein